MYTVRFTEKSTKQLEKLAENLRFQYRAFFKKLITNPFIGKLSDNTYHAHVKYHWVAVWEVNKNTKIVTIRYIGSREGAPY